MSRSTLCFLISLLALAAAAVLLFLGLKLPCAGALAAGIAGLLLYRRSTAGTIRAVRNGMDLLRSQDFASALRRTGIKDADEVVSLFNSLMANMKAERLKNEEQNAFLAKLIEASPMGVALCDFDGKIIDSNGPFRELAADAGVAATLADLDDGEQRTVRPGGSQVLRCSRMHFMDRGFRRRFYLIERITDEIVRSETELFHRIVRTMGHEVNNTLGGVVSVLETLQTIHADDEFIADTIGSCLGSCLALTAFVKAYSDVVKLPEAELQPTDLGDFVRDCAGFLASMCPAAITLRTETEGCATVSLDPMLMERVMVNGVKNAVESIGERTGEIIVRAAGRSIEITDNGPGLSTEAAGRVFTPFFSTKRADRGLGLMLVGDVLRKHKAAYTLRTATVDGHPRTTLKITF